MRQQLLAATLFVLSGSAFALHANEEHGLPSVQRCTKPCVVMRIEGTDGRASRVVLRSTPARSSIAGSDSTGTLELTTPATVAVPGDVQRVRIQVRAGLPVHVTFDSASVAPERMRPSIWGIDILLVRGEHGFTPMVQYHQLPRSPASSAQR